MKPRSFAPVLGLLLLVGCHPESRVGEQVEIVLDSPVDGKDSGSARLDQDHAISAAIVMLTSQAYATEVLHRLKREDATLFAREEDLQKRLSVTTIPENKLVQITFQYPDALVAERVVDMYEYCLVHNAVRAVNLGFHARPADETANHSPEPTPSAVH